MFRVLSQLSAVAVLTLAVSCKPAPVSNAEGPLPVAVTNSILADAVKNIGGSRIRVVTLVAANGDPHTYEPSPADIKAVADAKVFFENGLGFEPWSEKLFASSGSRSLRVIATQGIQALQMDEEDGHHDHHEENDPHVWNDVAHFIKISENVRDALIQADPAHAEIYRANAAAYLHTLQSLDAWVVQQVGLLPLEKRKLVTNHDVFAYFARRYQFEILGNAIGSLSTESQDPSAAHIVALVKEIKKTGVKTIFGDFSSNPKLIGQIAREAGVKIGPELFVDSLGAPGSPGDSYEKMMRSNVTAIVENLK